MANPLEVFFSLYFLLRPPFLARLLRRAIPLSDRITATFYSKENGHLVKCDLTKNSRWKSNLTSGDNIRAVTVIEPDDRLCSILSIPDSVSIVYFSGYQWKWTPDHSVLRMYDGASAFHLKYEEATELCDLIKGQIS